MEQRYNELTKFIIEQPGPDDLCEMDPDWWLNKAEVCLRQDLPITKTWEFFLNDDESKLEPRYRVDVPSNPNAPNRFPIVERQSTIKYGYSGTF